MNVIMEKNETTCNAQNSLPDFICCWYFQMYSFIHVHVHFLNMNCRMYTSLYNIYIYAFNTYVYLTNQNLSWIQEKRIHVKANITLQLVWCHQALNINRMHCCLQMWAHTHITRVYHYIYMCIKVVCVKLSTQCNIILSEAYLGQLNHNARHSRSPWTPSISIIANLINILKLK